MRVLLGVCAGALVVSVAARAADVTYGGRFGVNFAKYQAEYTSGSETSDSNMGLTIGGVVSMPISETMTFETGLQYAAKGGEEMVGAVEVNTSVDGLEIPATVRFDLADGKAYARAGVNLGFIVNAERRFLGGSEDIKDDLKTLNLDLVVGAGFTPPEGNLSIGIQYELGLTNVADWSAAEVAGGEPSEIKNRNLAIVFSFAF